MAVYLSYPNTVTVLKRRRGLYGIEERQLLWQAVVWVEMKRMKTSFVILMEN